MESTRFAENILTFSFESKKNQIIETNSTTLFHGNAIPKKIKLNRGKGSVVIPKINAMVP